MKRFFLLCIIFSISLTTLFLVNCQQPPKRSCMDFKTGKFKFSVIVSGDTLSSFVTRSEAIEVEYFQEQQDTSSLRWINNCEYVLKKLHPKNRVGEKSVHIKILTTTDSAYTFEFGAVKESKRLRGTAIKLN